LRSFQFDLGAKILSDQAIFKKFLVLGHTGFLGLNICNSLINNGDLVATVQSRINLQNLKEISTEYFANDTVVINCIASGVTPYTSSKDTDVLTNAKLCESLLKLFVKSRSSKFIHFGSIYEIDSEIKPVTDRLAYVNSKVSGSDITKYYAEMDARVKLVYLPTILGHNQPAGRFLIDFIRAANQNSSFFISYPNHRIKVAFYDSFFRFLCKVISSTDETVFHLPEDATMSVLQFSSLLNILLVKNGYNAVQVVTHKPDQTKQSELEMNEEFVAKIEQIIIYVAEKSK